ncbi:MAG: hypothetical protein WKG07_48145 [Hymenobacter sp.]
MNRQVRKMCAAVGLPCLRLVRQALGGLTLSGLAPGEWRDLTAEEGGRAARLGRGRRAPPAPGAARLPTPAYRPGPRRQRP